MGKVVGRGIRANSYCADPQDSGCYNMDSQWTMGVIECV